MILDFLFRAQGGTRILTSEDLARYLSARSSSAAGVDVTAERSMQFAAVATCVKILAESVGQLPLALYEQRAREKLKAVDHPLYPLLYVAPNEYQTAQEWKEWAVAGLALTGNSYSFINRVRDRVVELLPFQPGTVIPQRDPATRVVTYRVRVAGGKEETLPASQVLHLKLFSLDGLVGMSPLEQARESIGTGIAAEQHGATLFANDATPGGALESAKTLGDEAYKRLRASWDDRHQGAGNAHKTAILEDGVKWVSMAMPSTDAQWLESRKFSRSEIHGIFRVPPHLAGDLERATFSNIEHSSLDFVVHSLMPYLTRIEGRIALQLLTPAERKTFFAKFTVAALLRGDMAARGTFYTTMIQNGAMSPNEIRELEDRNPRDGGDVYLQPANMIVSGEKPATDPSPDPTPAPAPDPASK